MTKTSKQNPNTKRNTKKKTETKNRILERRRERRRQNRYPNVRIDPAGTGLVDTAFLAAVQAAVASLDFDDDTAFSEPEREFHQALRKEGIQGASQLVLEAQFRLYQEGDPLAPVLPHVLQMSYGTQLFEKIPEEMRRKFLPFNDVRVDFEGHDIVLHVSAMRRKSTDGGTAFYGRHQPKISLLGKEWTVAFSRHAVEQICNRLNPRYLTYAAAGDVHALLNHCVFYEPTILHPCQPSFVIWDTCGSPSNVRQPVYVDGVLGRENLIEDGGQCYYRVGYCPVVFEKNFAVAKTFLCPGFLNTPEYGLVRSSRLPALEKDLLLHTATSNDIRHVRDESIDSIKWFHDNGVPQVVQMPHTVFSY